MNPNIQIQRTGAVVISKANNGFVVYDNSNPALPITNIAKNATDLIKILTDIFITEVPTPSTDQ